MLMPSTGNVGLLVEVGYLVDRPAVNSHANVKFGMIFQRFANLQRAQNGRFETVSKNERAAIAGGQAQLTFLLLQRAELLRSAHDLLQRFESARSAR